MPNGNENTPCNPRDECHFTIVGGKGYCAKGPPDEYLYAPLLEAGETELHDRNLIEATSEINKILAKIPETEDGGQLSFIIYKKRALLAWINHGGEIDTNKTVGVLPEDEQVENKVVTSKDDDETIAKALKLKNWEDL